MPFWQFYQKSADWLDWPALLVQPSISAHRKWPEMVVSASTNQVWTKITIGSYAHVFCHSESDRSSVCNDFCSEIITWNRILLLSVKISQFLAHYSWLDDAQKGYADMPLCALSLFLCLEYVIDICSQGKICINFPQYNALLLTPE